MDLPPVRVVSLDLPSGFPPDGGEAPDGCVVADATVTLALPKRGLTDEAAPELCGDLYLADIGVPFSLWQRLESPLAPSAPVPQDLFHAGSLLRLQWDE